MRTKRATRVSYKEPSDSESSGEEYARPRKQYTGKKRGKRDDEGEDDDDEDWSESKAMKNGNKRRKKGNGTKSKKPVKENHFNALPPELYLDILSYLNPKDLLALARTNHLNRSFLISKKDSEQLWKKSFQRVGLPVLEAKDWSYPACADLVFTSHCDQCGRYSPSCIDPWLRRRLCKPCRKNSLIKLTKSYSSENNLHPLLDQCIVGSRFTPANVRHARWRRSENYVLPADIDSMNAKLVELQEEDENDFELDNSIEFSTLERRSTAHAWKETSKPSNQEASQDETSARLTRTVKAKKKNYREFEEEEQDENLVYRIGPRVQAFVEARKDHVENAQTDGTHLALVAKTAAWRVHGEEVALELTSRTRGIRSIFDTGANSRRREIKRRLGAIEAYEDNDLNCVAMKDLDPFLDGDDIDDEEWESIKPNLLRLVDAGKAKQARKDHKARLYESEVERKNSLRQFYDPIIDHLEEQGQFAPLFRDFLQFETIRPLWIGKDGDDLRKSITQEEWDDEVDEEELQAEFEDYHYNLLEKAVGLILSTNEEYPNETDLDRAIEKTLEGDLAAFFSNATSIVFCDAGCETTTSMTRPFAAWRGGIGSIKKTKGAAFFGSFPQVIAHQLTKHNDYKASKHDRRSRNKRQSDFRFALPLEVASLLGDFVEVLEEQQEDDDKNATTIQDLNLLDQGKLYHANVVKRHYLSIKWKPLVERIYISARKAARARPPINLEPPEIRFV
ncbi:F-box protein, partial [Sporobolomyces salmoneus]|uniref:F-box protein n=1 Tax=Sporobolomyces salmoneus TaxID=183962 RepID=UPI00317DCD4F